MHFSLESPDMHNPWVSLTMYYKLDLPPVSSNPEERRLCYSEKTLNHMSEEIRRRTFPFSLSQKVLWISLLSILMETLISEDGL